MLGIDNETYYSIIGIIVFFTLITITYYYRKSKYEREPIHMIILAFLLGVFSTIPAILISIFSLLFINNPFFYGAIMVPIVEELCKFVFIVLLTRSKHFDGAMSGLVYGAMIGAGFSAAEDFIYGVIYTGGSIGVTFARSFIQIIGHPLFTGIAGIGVGTAKVSNYKLQEGKYFSKLPKAMILHGIWNGAAALVSPIFIIPVLILIGIVFIITLRNEIDEALIVDHVLYETGHYHKKNAYTEDDELYIINADQYQ